MTLEMEEAAQEAVTFVVPAVVLEPVVSVEAVASPLDDPIKT